MTHTPATLPGGESAPLPWVYDEGFIFDETGEEIAQITFAPDVECTAAEGEKLKAKWAEQHANAALIVSAVNRSPLVEEMATALEPFAEAASAYDSDEDDSNQVAWAHDFPIGALRRARAVLTRARKSAP